ncbi:hypothetical protein [Halorarius litoreus]|uniref:hypothetical protein n=1 Tax=Halorarius litoreus TaxID=2962676 RepID=UPI0020CE315B|nr:hypothetical protein [Halorarius litoreus]
MSGNTLTPFWPDVRAGLTKRLTSVIRGTAFWIATFLPLSYISLAVLDPIRLLDPRLFGTLVSVNILALVLGHGYGDEESEPSN